MILSITRRNATPAVKPKMAGMVRLTPSPPDMFMAGMSSDQTAAAIITPAVKPMNAFFVSGGIVSFIV